MQRIIIYWNNKFEKPKKKEKNHAILQGKQRERRIGLKKNKLTF